MRGLHPLARAVWPSVALGVLGLVSVLGAYDSRGLDRLLPHGYCYTWQPTLLVTHVVGDGLIGLAYVSIPVTLMTFVRRRTDIPFNGIGVLFALFIITCGLTHFMEIWTIWHPDYWLSGMVKALCAAISLPTAVVLVYLLPRLLELPTAQQMARTLQALEEEVAARRQAEHALRLERDALEQRVQARTADLEQARDAEWLARARAESANEAKDRFLASVSHELRTPMQAVQGWAQVLALQPEVPAGARAAIDRIQDSVRAQARIVDDLLDLSRIVSGKVQVDLQSVDCRAVIDQAVASVRHRAAAKGVSVVVDDVACAVVRADAQRLQQVLANLLLNALQASSPGQSVHVDCLPMADRLRVEVRDRGVGIETTAIEGLFEPFKQGTGRSKAGLGLGLPISRALVQEMGGTLEAVSAGPGQGATFIVSLPVSDRDRGGAVASRPATGAGEWRTLVRRLGAARVLYVEDDEVVRASIATLLQGLGLRVDVAATSSQAVQALRAGRFDILVCDLGLDGPEDGLDLVRMLRAAGGRQPALAVSARGFPQEIAASLAAGFDDHLTKPLDGRTLVTRMAELLEGRHARPRGRGGAMPGEGDVDPGPG